MMTFEPGDRVHVPALGTGVVREVRNGGRYLIELKGRSVVVDGRQLERAGRGANEIKESTPPDSPPTRTRASAPSLDLHGKTVIEAIEALEAFLNDVLLDGAAEVQVIHGRGGGRLKAAVHGRLKQMASVRGFRLDPRNPGVTLVRL